MTRLTKGEKIQKTLKYMKSKQYRECIDDVQRQCKDLTNRDIEFFNMGKECFRRYVLRTIDEKIAECKQEDFAEADEVIGSFEELREELK